MATTRVSLMMYSAEQLRHIADIMEALNAVTKPDNRQAYPDAKINIYGEDFSAGILGVIDSREFNEFFFYPVYSDAGEEVQE